jgi:hypothetical protein
MATQIMQNGALKVVQSFAQPGVAPPGFVLPLGAYVLQATADGSDDGYNNPATISLYQGSVASGTLLGTLNTVVSPNLPMAYTGVLLFSTSGGTLTISIAAGANGALPSEVQIWGSQQASGQQP